MNIKKILFLSTATIAISIFSPLNAHADAQLGIDLSCGLIFTEPNAPPDSIVTHDNSAECKRAKRKQEREAKKEQEEKEEHRAGMTDEERKKDEDVDSMMNGGWSSQDWE